MGAPRGMRWVCSFYCFLRSVTPRDSRALNVLPPWFILMEGVGVICWLLRRQGPKSPSSSRLSSFWLLIQPTKDCGSPHLTPSACSLLGNGVDMCPRASPTHSGPCIPTQECGSRGECWSELRVSSFSACIAFESHTELVSWRDCLQLGWHRGEKQMS